MELKLISSDNGSVKGSVNVEESIFAVDYNETLVHQLVTAYQAAGRAGTKAQKNRAAVRGGGAKPWRQKGTGRARAGTSSSPIWRKGGVTFAANPRDYAQKLNKKMYRKGIKVILSQLIRDERLSAIEDVRVGEAKTKLLATKLSNINIDCGLFVVDELDVNTGLAIRNIPKVSMITSGEINPVNLVKSERVYITEQALRKLEEGLK